MAQHLAKHFHWVITRPAHQAKKWQAYFEQHSLAFTLLPMLDIQPLSTHLDEADLHHLSHADFIIITSPNSITFLPENGLAVLKGQASKLYTMGAGTTDALVAQQIYPHYTPPHGFTSEDMLAHLSLSNVHNKKIVLLSGRGGRRALETQLSGLCAQITKIPIYMRQQKQHKESEVIALFSKLSQLEPIFLLTSVSCVLAILENTPASWQTWIKQQRIIVISQRLQDKAMTLGFSQVCLVPSMDVSHIVQQNSFVLC